MLKDLKRGTVLYFMPVYFGYAGGEIRECVIKSIKTEGFVTTIHIEHNYPEKIGKTLVGYAFGDTALNAGYIFSANKAHLEWNNNPQMCYQGSLGGVRKE